MTTDTTTPEATTTEKVEYEKGSWQAALDRSATLFAQSGKAKTRAGLLLWQGASAAIAEWETDVDSDPAAEGLAEELLAIMGTSRKGDVSKIKKVAVAVGSHGLDISSFPNLSKAYAAASDLIDKAPERKAEDDAAESVIEEIAEKAPKTASSVDSAALILLSKGLDGAIVAILDALNGPTGEFNEAASRSFLRGVQTEIAARVTAAKPKPAPRVKAEPKEKATPAAKTKAAPKAKPAATKAKPVSASKGDPNKKALPPKAKPVEAEADPAADLFADETETEVAETPAPKAKPVRRAKPVAQRA